MTTPRLLAILLLALLGSGVVPGAAAQAPEPLRLVLSHARLDVTEGDSSLLLLEAAVTNPNPFPVDVELKVQGTAEGDAQPVALIPFQSPPDHVPGGATRAFRVSLRAPGDSVGSHVLSITAEALGGAAPVATASVPLRVHSIEEWQARAQEPGDRRLALLWVGDPPRSYDGKYLFFEADLENVGGAAALSIELDDPQGGLSPTGGGTMRLFPGERVRVQRMLTLEDDAPSSFEAELVFTLSHPFGPRQITRVPLTVRLPLPAAPTESSADLEARHSATRLAPPEGPVRASPGENVTFVARVTNGGSTAYAFHADLAGVYAQDADGVRWAARERGWLSRIGAERSEAPPGEAFDLPITLRVPEDAPPGGRFVALVVFSVFAGYESRSHLAEVEVMVEGSPAPLVPGLGGLDVPSAALGAALLAAAAVAAALLALRREAWRWALLAALYTRISRGRTLDHDTRQALLRIVAASPGIHYSEIKRRTGLNTGTLVHHLRALEAQGHLVGRREGTLRRFYAPGAQPVPPPPSVLRTPVQERVLALLDERPMTQRELAETLGLSQQGLNHHVKTLERKGLLVSTRGEDGVHRWRRASPSAAER